jgi:uncharacterized protein DUF3999
MKICAGLLAAAMLAGPYFQQQRKVDAPGSGQHYFAVDATIWKSARPDLGDLRLYSGENEIPYALMVQRGSLEHDHKSVRVLQQASVAGKTQFLIDMAGVVEYDHIDLNLATKNFVAHAKVEGQDDPHGTHWAVVAEPILYDLSRENLGENSMLRLPLSTYKYLRVTIDGPVKPADVLGASSEFRQEQKAVWRDVANSPPSSDRGHDSVRVFDIPQNVPVERVLFEIVDADQGNFLRQVEVTNDKGMRLGGGEISKVQMVRNGNKIDTERVEVEFSALGEKTITVIIHNGDDKPLQLTAKLQQHERRIYFDAPPSGTLMLYYGDEKLERPVYDYAKLFQEQNAAEARLGAAETNAAYTGRPDERPWSERHPAVLWIAIIAAVLILGAVALRSMKTAATS